MVTYWDIKPINEATFYEDAMQLPWLGIWNLRTVDEKIETFNNLVLQLYDKHAPQKTKRMTKKFPAPWMTSTVRDLMTDRDLSYRRYRRDKSDVNLQNYKRLRNKTNQAIRNAKLRFMHRLIDPNMTQRDVWKNVHSLGIGRTKRNSENITIPLERLNEHFTTIPCVPTGNIMQRNLTEEQGQIDAPTHEKFFFTYVTTADVRKALNRIKSKATGADNISISLIHKIIDIVLPTVTHIFNASLMTSTFPDIWKQAFIRPLPKVDTPTTPTDFRPISILPTLSKALERIVYKQLTDYLNKYNLFDKYQSGFRAGHSTATALLKVTEDIREAMDEQNITLLTLLDFSKAFDSVNIDLLIHKLRLLHLSDHAVSWFNSYLCDRRQCVTSGNQTSSWRIVRTGVPQGSVLGPLLFTMYVNDISSVLRHCKYHMYADDLQLYIHTRPGSLNDAIHKVNEDLDLILTWTRKVGLALNAEKSQAILIGRQRLLCTTNQNSQPLIKINNKSIPFSSSVKNLGVHMDSNLHWTDHISKTSQKVFAILHSLYHLKKISTPKPKKDSSANTYNASFRLLRFFTD